MLSGSLILRSLYLQWLLVKFFPRLREWPIGEWPEVLDKALVGEFDHCEQIGIIVAVVFVTWLLKPQSIPNESVVDIYLNQLLLSLPCLVVLVGPLYIRRIRRELDEAAKLKHVTHGQNSISE